MSYYLVKTDLIYYIHIVEFYTVVCVMLIPFKWGWESTSEFHFTPHTREVALFNP